MTAFRLKREDSPVPDPHQIAVDLLDQLREMVADSGDLQRLLTRWGENPTEVFRRAQARSIEIHEAASRALESGEALVQAKRREGAFAFQYREV